MNKMLESESVEETRNIVRSSHSSSKHDDCKNGIFLGKFMICQKMAMFEQLNDQLLVSSKLILAPH